MTLSLMGCGKGVDAVAGLAAMTMNPADAANITFSGGNLTLTAPSAIGGARSTRPILTKSYFEFLVIVEADTVVFGLVDTAASFTVNWFATNSAHILSWGNGYGQYAGSSIGYSKGTGHQGLAYDPSSSKVWLANNTGWLNGDPIAATGGMSIAAMSTPYAGFNGDAGDKGTFFFDPAGFTLSVAAAAIAAGYGTV